MTLTSLIGDYRRDAGEVSSGALPVPICLTVIMQTWRLLVSPATRLRPLRLQEIEALAAVIPETTAAQLANRWREQGLGYRELLAAERDGELVGTVSIADADRPWRALHLFALEVAQPRRNQGVGAESCAGCWRRRDAGDAGGCSWRCASITRRGGCTSGWASGVSGRSSSTPGGCSTTMGRRRGWKSRRCGW